MTINFNQAVSAYNAAAKMETNPLAMPALDEAKAGGPSFPELVGQALDKAISTGYKGESISAKAIAGKAELTDLVTAIDNVDLALNTVVSMRDRMINAYNDIIRMPI